MKQRLRLALGLAISLLFLFLAVRNLDWSQLWQLFRQARYLYLAPALGLLVIINYLRAYRWRLLMHPDSGLPLPKVFRYVNIGYFFNNILPAKAGEVVRAFLVGRQIAGGIGQAVSSLLIERLMDVLTLVVLLVVLIPFVNLPPWATRAGLTFGGAAIGGTVTLIILSRFGTRGVDWIWRLVGRIPVVGHPKLKAAVQNLVDGFGVLTMGKLVPGILISSALIWLGYATFNYTLMAAFRMTHLPFGAAALVLCATGFSMVIPSSPGAMGVFEWAGVQALAVYGVEPSQAFGYTFGLHTYTNLALILFGLIGLAQEGLSYSQIRNQVMARAEEVTSADPSS